LELIFRMIINYIVRGVKAGLIAGIIFGLFMAIVANPLIAYADEINHNSIEEEHSHEDGSHDHTESTNSVMTNKIVSILSAGLWGILLGGGVFGLTYYIIEPVVPGTGTLKSYLLAVGGFITISGAPWLVLPPTSPGVQQSIPSDTRTLIYAGMMIIGAGICLLSGIVYRRSESSMGQRVATIIGVLPFGLLLIPPILLPENTTQSTLPEDLQAGMIGIVVFSQLILWIILATSHAWLQSNNTIKKQPAEATNQELASN
jgi:predicted cobalt transporter CbtA